MKIKFLLYFLILSFNLYSQSILVTTQGERFEFKRKTIKNYEFKKDRLKLKSKKETKYFNVNEIYGYYSYPEDEFYYLKNYTFTYNPLYKFFIPGVSTNSGDFFTKKIIDGKIKVYFNEYYFNNTEKNRIAEFNPDINSNQYFLEKNNEFYNFYGEGSYVNNLTENYEKFKTYFKDDPEIFKKLNIRKIDINEALELIENYNLNQFTKPDINNKYRNIIVFYRDKGKKRINFSVNEKEYYLDANDKLEIELPYEKESLVTIKNKNYTKLIISSELYTKCYEVTDKGIILKNSNSSYVKARLKFIEKKQKKR